jgi:hypothetical protein
MVDNLLAVANRDYRMFYRGTAYINVTTSVDGGVELSVDTVPAGSFIELDLLEYAAKLRYPKWMVEEAERFGYTTTFALLCDAVFSLNYLTLEALEEISYDKQKEMECCFRSVLDRYLSKESRRIIKEVAEHLE